ncbi:hypothetical protein D1AOALGA4SA_6849 [Olavius algarvensis Delta 1 endosymbiont]|nr:hypothetical protein D1AOALGA4SA_6849 [Olavius algarvensis Delta 1 endosymbiont]
MQLQSQTGRHGNIPDYRELCPTIKMKQAEIKRNPEIRKGREIKNLHITRFIVHLSCKGFNYREL